MEDVLTVYERAYDPTRPVVCLDETSRQLLGEVRTPLPVTSGRPARHDPEYVRGGVANVFLATEPLRGWREHLVSAQRTRLDWAGFIAHLANDVYPDAAQLVLVLDQLNTHSPAALYEAFPPAEAKRLADRLEIHYTPKHGSWLNIAELELAVLERQCLRQRFGHRPALAAAATAWAARRNAAATTIDWHFTTTDARLKLKRLYPAIEG